MGYTIDFGFENPGASWNDAYLALLFASDDEARDVGHKPGPTAVADASRYVELFEMQVGLSPLAIGAYSEVVGGPDPASVAAERAAEARARGMFPVIVGGDRRVTEKACRDPLVALWGTVGRAEADEPAILGNRASVLAGVRAATNKAFKAIPGSVTIIPARGLVAQREVFGAALSRISDPVHLSIDIDVLAPAVARAPRSVEPGGLSWYDLMDAIEIVFNGPGVAAADLVGVGGLEPRTAGALVGAQILLKLAGLLAAGLGQ